MPKYSERIHNFFEAPKGLAARLVQIFIILLILVSLATVVIEFAYPQIHRQYQRELELANWIVVAVFTVEYLLRITTAPKKLRWIRRPLNVVDFLAVFPNYIELLLPFFVNTAEIRALRLIRLLRFSRVLRGFRLLRFGNLFRRVLRYEGTILQAITPVIVLFVAAKGVIWVLERYGLWFQDANLGELFAIIGFALGIILSQKIGVSYDKFIQVEEAAVRLYASLRSLSLYLDRLQPGLGTQACHRWAVAFQRLLRDPNGENHSIHAINDELYSVISQVERQPADLALMHASICGDAAFCLSKKSRLIPKAYDTLLHQVTMLYLTLIVVFIPGATGLISVIIAAYTLYGMYNLTQDFDSILGGEFNLININISELDQFATTGK